MTMTFENEKNFTKTPNALFKLYTRLDDFTAAHAMLWTVLRNYHNEAEGYAYPSQDQLAFDMGCSDKTIRKMLKVLENRNLLKIDDQRGSKNNNQYHLKMPLTTMEEFIAAFPDDDVEQKFKDHAAFIERRRAERDKNLAQAAAKHAEQAQADQKHEERATKAAEKTAAIVKQSTKSEDSQPDLVARKTQIPKQEPIQSHRDPLDDEDLSWI